MWNIPILCKSIALSIFWLVAAPALRAEDCKLKFSVARNDGKALRVGLTPEQKKFWGHDAAKKFNSMCLNDKEPNFIILWSDGLDGAELAKASIDHFNVVRSTSEYAETDINLHGSLSANTVYFRQSSAIGAKAEYLIFDAAKNPYVVIRQGQGYQDVTLSPHANQPGQKVKAEELASTIADPAAAMENALKWLKKEKKL
jgi:hypothetical protein